MFDLFDLLVSIVIIALGLLLAYDSFQKWRATGQRYWYLFSVALAALAAVAAFSSWSSGALLIILALMIRLFVEK